MGKAMKMKGSQWKGRKNEGRKMGKGRKERKKGSLNFQLPI